MGQTLDVIIEYCCCCCFSGRRDKERQSVKTFLSLGREWESVKSNKPIYPNHVEDDAVTEQIESGLTTKRSALGQWDFDKEVLKKKKYEIVGDSIIGQGGFGRVYKVKDSHGVVLAAKVMELTKQMLFQKNRFEAFKHEVIILKRHNHQNIIKVVDHFICDRSISFMIMEFAEGGNLEHRLKLRKMPFPEEEAKRYFVQISNALFYLHSNGIAHNDLKLSNILIWISESKEIIKVTDFGCSRQAIQDDSGLILTTKPLGTVAYMSPEQIRLYISEKLNRPDLLNVKAKPYSALKSDMWALGVCLYQFVCYDRPFYCKNHNKRPKELHKMLVKMESHCLELPEQFFHSLSKDCIDLIMGLLEADDTQRYDIKVVMSHLWVTTSDLYDPITLNPDLVY